MEIVIAIVLGIVASSIGFIIGLIIAKSKQKSKFKQEIYEPVILSKVVLPKRINEREYNQRVNAALKDVINKTVDAWVIEDDKVCKLTLANRLYNEWHAKIPNLSYSNYNPDLQELALFGRKVGVGFKFEAIWLKKKPKSDCLSYARSHKELKK